MEIFDFNEYKRLGEPDKQEKAENWEAAIGLQAVDGLTPSPYLVELAKKNIEGEISIDEVKKCIATYYKIEEHRKHESRTEEADTVAARINELLAEKTFSLSPIELFSIHERLFEGIYEFAGKIRDYNISKDEWVLGGDTVFYAGASNLKNTLDYDFQQEKAFDYSRLSKTETLRHITKFISGIWQIHPFGEGNTRTIVVFTVKYLRKFGFSINNEHFKQNSWYFRNALVRANYSSIEKNIYATTEFLDRFFDNLVLDQNHTLRSREMRIIPS